MMRFKVIALQIIINVVIAFIMIKAFVLGVALEKEIWGWDYWFVTIVIGAIVTAAAYKFLMIVKSFISFPLKAAYIYSITSNEDSLLKCLGFVTVDFKEFAGVTALNIAIRKFMKELTDKMYEASEEIEFLKRFKRLSFITNLDNSPIVTIAKKLTLKTFDYADECVLAYCYAKDDALLKNCFNGFCQFIKHAIKTSAIIVSYMIISTIIKVAIVIGCVWYYVEHFTFSPISIVSGYITLMTILFIWEDSVYETLCCYSTVKSFMKEVDVEEEPDNEIQSALEAMVDVTELKAIINRFGGESKERINDNVEEGTRSGDSDGSDVSEGMDSGI